MTRQPPSTERPDGLERRGDSSGPPDAADRRILAALQADGRATYAEIGALVGLSAPSVHERVRKLQRRGVLAGFTATLRADALGFGILAFVGVVQDSSGEWHALARHFSTIPEVDECHHVAGDEDFLLKVRARDTQHLEGILNTIQASRHVATTRTTVVLSTAFAGRGVPLHEAGEVPHAPAERDLETDARAGA
jgi:Lrp/AsnC family transcriptional regulator, leucine-responsive regulatory protein